MRVKACHIQGPTLGRVTRSCSLADLVELKAGGEGLVWGRRCQEESSCPRSEYSTGITLFLRELLVWI